MGPSTVPVSSLPSRTQPVSERDRMFVAGGYCSRIPIIRPASEAGGERPTIRRPRVEQVDERSSFACDRARVRG